MNSLQHDIRSLLKNPSSIKNINRDERFLSVSFMHLRIIVSAIVFLVSTRISISRKPRQKFRRIMSLAEFPTESHRRRRSRCAFLFRSKDFLSGWRIWNCNAIGPHSHSRASDIRASFILLVGPAVIWSATLKFWRISLPVRPAPRDSDVTRLLSVTKSS